ncbi:oligopeptidase f [Trichococcus flocculiformis]|uniref:Oligopeptidase F n=1 Tax=Trichococcus flocculiformis TaxID=82803 RepID=A0AB38BFJ9_9LACT|nr:oligoendopeptidase F [Trichococcus flocculiformis]CZQ85313.1 oligopeptidase f [Trichococcus flocculiformis]SFH58357.1 oligoendopeptidase F [Trichococcus flocculiformis]
MTNTEKHLKRAEVPEASTWDLTAIFPTDAAFEKELDELAGAVPFIRALQGTIGSSSQALLKGIEEVLEINQKLERVYVYSHLKNDQDTSDSLYQNLHDKALSILTSVSEATSWFEPEIMEIPEDELEKYLAENDKLKPYAHLLDSLTSAREHVLTAREEELLAGAGEIFAAPSKTFSVLNNADMTFPKVKNEEGQEVQLTHGLYGKLMESPDREVREGAFKALYKTYDGLKNTFATTLSTNVKAHNYKAKVHKYESARAAALANNHIPESVYDTLLDVVNEHLPLLHRYVDLRKDLLGVEELHMYDMYTPLTGEAPIKYSIEAAMEETLKGLQPLGEDYLAILQEAFDNRWIDWLENEGKRSGAYSSGAYDTNPYILMNWQDSLNQLYTLVHELGHSVHSYLTRKSQPYVYGDYSIFLAEIASTTNENILTDYLLKTQTDPKVRIYILNHYLDGFKGTIFRQTQFAEFEHYIHQKALEGVPLTQDFMTSYYAELNAKYYGPSVEKDPEIGIEWTRIPHFYYNYYVYQYATGFSAATALAKRIVEGEEGALEKYLSYLKAGNSDYPIEVMKKAGVDMTQSAYIEDAMKVFEERLNELEQLIAAQQA